MELCREVGKSFEAVRSNGSGHYPGDEDSNRVGTIDANTSFSAMLSCLEEKNKELITELSKSKKTALEHGKLRQQLEARQKASEKDLDVARAEIDVLRAEKSRLHAQVKRYSKRLQRSEKEIRVAFRAIQRCGLDIGWSAPELGEVCIQRDGE